MGSTTSKEEVIVAQTAAGGSNVATVAKEQLATTNTVLFFIATCFALMIIGVVFWLYRRCHQNWIEEKIRQREMQRVVQTA
ncbi:hypothetical protein B5X24_HaOG209370 [Helicoverpa armigera]|nr:hypothetical protein B5X24_HaOG209370 [Helicoverpa armigera]